MEPSLTKANRSPNAPPRDECQAAISSGNVRQIKYRLLHLSLEDLPRKQVYAAYASATALRFDNDRYSVNASAIGRPVGIRAYDDRVVIRQDGRVVAGHRRAFGRRATVFDPWRYVPVLARNPSPLDQVSNQDRQLSAHNSNLLRKPEPLVRFAPLSKGPR